MRCAIGVLLLCSAPAFAGEPTYSWRSRADDPDRTYLYLDGKQIGGWDYRARHYRPYDGTNWGAPTGVAPVTPPQQRGAVVPQPPTVVVKIPPQVIVTEPLAPLPPLRGPLSARLGTAMGHVMADMTVKMFKAVPGALVESLKRGDYQLEFKPGVTAPPEPSAMPVAPPVVVQPVPSPPRRGIFRR